MKTRIQKQQDVKEAGELIGKSKTLVFTDFGKVSAEDMRKLRHEVKGAGGKLTVVKKRLLNVALKEKGIDYDLRQFEGSVGTIFAEGTIDTIAGTVHRFFSALGATALAREESAKKILGGFDLEKKEALDRATVIAVGKLPSREVLLGQVLGMLAAPMSQLLYTLQQKSEASK